MCPRVLRLCGNSFILGIEINVNFFLRHMSVIKCVKRASFTLGKEEIVLLIVLLCQLSLIEF